MWRSTQVSWLPAAYFPCPTWQTLLSLAFLLSVLLLILHFLSSPLWLLSLSDIFLWFSWGYAKKPDNLGACSPRESSAESEWLDHYSDNPKICCCIMWQFEQKLTNERSVPGLWSCAGADGVPFWLRFYMALVCLCLHMCVWKRKERVLLRRWGECTVQCIGLEAGYSVFTKTESVHLPLPPTLCLSLSLSESIILSTVYGEELQMNQLSLFFSLSLSPSTSLLFCISTLHMSPEQNYPPHASTLQ